MAKEETANWVTYSVHRTDAMSIRERLAEARISTQFVGQTPSTYKFKVSPYYEADTDAAIAEYYSKKGRVK